MHAGGRATLNVVSHWGLKEDKEKKTKEEDGG